MRCCDCEFRRQCDEREQVLTAFVKCYKRDALLANKTRSAAPATNADHIRAMSDDELAEQLVINVDGLSKKRVYLAAPVGEIFARRDIAEAHTLEWLQQPYKEDET